MMYWILAPEILNKIWMSILCIQLLFFYSSIKPADLKLPKPFEIATTTPRSKSLGHMTPYEVSKRTHVTADIYKSKGKLYLQITLYFKGVQIMQNDYEIDPREVAKL
jgi:hypothetical protein